MIKGLWDSMVMNRRIMKMLTINVIILIFYVNGTRFTKKSIIILANL